MKYKDLEVKTENLHKFDSRSQFNAFLMEYAAEVYSNIKEGNVDWLREAVDDLLSLMDDMRRDFIIPDVTDSEMNAVQLIVNAAQKRMYG